MRSLYLSVYPSMLAICAASVFAAPPKKSAGSSKKTPPAPNPAAAAPFTAPAADAAVEVPDDKLDLIAEISQAGESGMFAPLGDLGEMRTLGFVEVNEGNKDASGNVAVRITPAGSAWVAENVSLDVEEGPEASAFQIDDDVPLPTGSRAPRTGKYPFDSLGVGQSFHIPATAESPSPNARYGSAVTSANKRYKDAAKEGETPRSFKIRAVGADDKRGKGARVFRVA